MFYLILILIVNFRNSVQQTQISSIYELYDNQELITNIEQTSLIRNLTKNSKLQCLSECAKNENCATVSFKMSNNICRMHSKYMTKNFNKSSADTATYSKKG